MDKDIHSESFKNSFESVLKDCELTAFVKDVIGAVHNAVKTRTFIEITRGVKNIDFLNQFQQKDVFDVVDQIHGEFPEARQYIAEIHLTPHHATDADTDALSQYYRRRGAASFIVNVSNIRKAYPGDGYVLVRTSSEEIFKHAFGEIGMDLFSSHQQFETPLAQGALKMLDKQTKEKQDEVEPLGPNDILVVNHNRIQEITTVINHRLLNNEVKLIERSGGADEIHIDLSGQGYIPTPVVKSLEYRFKKAGWAEVEYSASIKKITLLKPRT